MLKILVVEDNPNAAEIAQLHLEFDGHEVVVAQNGKQAVEIVDDVAPNVILMDMHMPVMDGYEATRILKSRPQSQEIPIVAMTAANMAQDQKMAREAGCDEFVAKPIDWETFSGRLNSIVPSGQAN